MLLLVLTVGGCSTGYRPIQGVEGIRTADGGATLDVIYDVDTCADRPHVQTSEDAHTVAIRIRVKKFSGSCGGQGEVGPLVVHLRHPLGSRTVDIGVGAPIVPIDGDLLLTPTWLPAGYPRETFPGFPVSHGWKRTWEPSGACSTAAPELTVFQAGGPSAARSPTQASTGLTWQPVPGSYSVGGMPAHVLSAPAQGDWWVTWTIPATGHDAGSTSAAVHSSCPGAPATPLSDVLRFADGLSRGSAA